ncbi:MAG: EamA family transporter [Promethearchaeota archaeon]
MILSSSVNGFSYIQSSFLNGNFQLSAFLMGLIYYLELINWFYCVKHVNVSVASSITTPTPIVTTLLTFLFFSTVIQIYQIVGMIIVLVSLFGLILVGYWLIKLLPLIQLRYKPFFHTDIDKKTVGIVGVP